MHTKYATALDRSPLLSRPAILCSLLIFICSAAPRLFFASRVEAPALLRAIPDAGTYIAPAENVLRHGAFLNRHQQPEVSRTPGYPLFIAGLLLVTGDHLRAALIVQAAILSLTPVLLYWLAGSLMPAPLAFAAGVLAALSPWGVVQACLPLTEGLYVFALAILFLGMAHVRQLKHPISLAAAGLCFGLLTAAVVLIRPVSLLLVAIGVSLFLVYGPRRKAAWVLPVTMLVCASVPLALWSQRNARLTHFSGLSDISGKAAWWYLASDVTARAENRDRYVVKDAAMAQDRRSGLPLDQANRTRWKEATAVFLRHPALVVICFTRNVCEQMLHPDPGMLTPVRARFRGDTLVLAAWWMIYLSLALLGWRAAGRAEVEGGGPRRLVLLLLLATCLLLTLTSGVTFGQGARMRAPLEAIVPLLSALGSVQLLRWSARFRARAWVVGQPRRVSPR